MYYKASLDRLRRCPDGLGIDMTAVRSSRTIRREGQRSTAIGGFVHFFQCDQIHEWRVSIAMARGCHVSDDSSNEQTGESEHEIMDQALGKRGWRFEEARGPHVNIEA